MFLQSERNSVLFPSLAANGSRLSNQPMGYVRRALKSHSLEKLDRYIREKKEKKKYRRGSRVHLKMKRWL